MMKILVIIPMLFSATATAEDMWLNLHTGSVHNKNTVHKDGKSYQVNGFNPGLGLELPASDSDNQSYRLGFFKNSYSKLSLYGGVDLHTNYSNGFGTGITFGAVSGYKDSPADRNVIPGVIPRVLYIFNDYRAEMSFLYGRYASALTLTVGRKF